MTPKLWMFAATVGLGFAMSGGFAWMLPRGRRVPPRPWEWIFVLSVGPVLFTGIAALVCLDRPAWVPAAPAFTWYVWLIYSLAAVAVALAGGHAWLTTRLRWRAAEMGEPLLAADLFADLSLRRMGGDPPRLRPAAEVPLSWRSHLLSSGVAAVVLLTASWMSVGRWPAVIGGMLRGLTPALFLSGAGLGLTALTWLVGDWWGVPVRRWFVTADGFLAGGMTVRWADADAVALGPAPGPADGTELLAVTGPTLLRPCTVRLLVDPAAAPALRTILAAAGVAPAALPDPARPQSRPPA